MTDPHRQSPVSLTHRLSGWNVTYSIIMAVACVISYLIMTSVLNSFVVRDNDIVGGMWAAIATAFVFRDTSSGSLAAGASRLAATCVSFALCLAYLWLFRPTAAGMALLLAVGSLVMLLLNRREEVMTTAITTIVVMAVAILSPADAWLQPLLRLIDTLVGILVGVLCNGAALFVFGTAVRNTLHPED